LVLHSLNDAASRQLTRYLPDMMSLRNLNVGRMWDCDPATFLHALPGNGSLQTVSLGSVSPWASLVTAERHRIQSYCDRNRWACGVLQNLDEEDGMLLCPSLCPWRMAPSAFLSVLLACNEAIGPRGHVKRMAL
jgi:hypothetical protein